MRNTQLNKRLVHFCLIGCKILPSSAPPTNETLWNSDVMEQRFGARTKKPTQAGDGPEWVFV
ncbi:hypothetical protein Pla52o_55100 [Novipirellula galeiformis]|uniref:Uncharacterized protein n=1 Tax=Novipirellula galeiformis TaxID=2528004 RepID=A0A5C6BRU2_9BACT|nr:hypothetical protein Pla52o_55100 [Novipirellula galeiformis]